MLKHIHSLICLLLLAPAISMAQGEYFQQDVAYDIRVRLDDQRHRLTGHWKMTYTNNSQETLTSIYLHLWPNAYRSTTTEFARQKSLDGNARFQEAEEWMRGYIDSLSFKVDGVEVEHGFHQGIEDIGEVQLPKPLPPGGTITMESPFLVQIPSSWSRLGHVKQQYQICQWYPKPAVFDKNGWNQMSYLDQGEFYSEFGSFDVYIEVPKNYVVGATGDLAPDDPEWNWLAEREALSRKMMEQPVAESKFEYAFPEDEYKTLHFHQENVHDFAWFCDKDYYVLADTVKLARSGREVRCVAMFTNLDRDLWKEAPRYVAQSVADYSEWNGDYPYNHATAVDGALSAGAGMEYPNITVLGAGGSAESLERVIMHEVGHNWYYGILGSNEREHPWMDEGINTYFENRYWEKHHEGAFAGLPRNLSFLLGKEVDGNFIGREGYKIMSTEGLDQPIEFPSQEYLPINYGLIVYAKTGQAFRYLEQYLGREVIDRCFRTYFDRWKFRHPQPEDIQQVFEEVSGKDLSWFFQGYIQGTEQLDFRITKLKGNVATLKNQVDIPLPASIGLVDEEGKVLQTIWTEPFTGTTEVELPSSDGKFLQIDPQQAIPEYRDNNNRMRRKGLLRRKRPMRLSFGYKFPDPKRFNLNLLPVAGFNTTDGIMAGFLLYEGFLPRERFSFHAMPMFGFRSKHLVGSGGFTLRWAHKGPFSKIELSSRMSSFSTFARNRTALDFALARDNARSRWSHEFSLISQIVAVRTLESGLLPENWFLPVYGSVNWHSKRKGLYSTLDAFGEIGGNVAEGLARLSLDTRYGRKIGKKMRMDLRGFVGGILSRDPAPYLLQYRVSGSLDPFGEYILLDRAGNSSWLSNQIMDDHGGFSSLTGGTFDRGLLALNAHFKTPVPLLGVFADVAQGIGTQSLPNQAFWDAGVRLTLVRNVFHINFPLAGTAFDGLPSDGDAFVRGINFMLDLGRLGQLGDITNLIMN
jgi:hypothetical protein